MAVVVPDSSGEFGNTKLSGKVKNNKQIPPSKHWCFTLNNYSHDDILKISSSSSISKYVFQEEKGEKEETPHLQGYIEFKKKIRPKELFNDKIHWEKTRSIEHSIMYCSKEETRIGQIYTNFLFDDKLKLLKETELYIWQKEILELCKKTPDDRTINWYWEKDGCVGKTALSKLLCANYGALCVSGKSSDCKYAIVKFKETKKYYPKIIIFDIPRCNIDYINYEAIEKIKDGLFFVGKYESQQVIMNSPHIIVFSNEEPQIDKLSKDRWNIKKLY